jgi:spore maturation protein CgeB
MSSAANVAIQPLLQASNPSRFRPGLPAPLVNSNILFVGKSRNVFRPIVRDAIALGAKLSIFGDGWGQFVPEQYIKAEFLENDQVPSAYGAAAIVLNDHWEDMRVEGFLSNRLFDAVGTGARVISDDMKGQSEIFGGSVVEYHDAVELAAILSPDNTWPDQSTLLRNADTVHQDHSFYRRAQTLLHDVESLLSRK